MSTPLRVLSMGWGVQSFTLAAMMAFDELPRVDFIVHADTGHEMSGTYELRRKMEPWLGEHGLKVVTVTGKRTDVVREDWSDSVLIPAFAFAREGDKDAGQVRRQCTHDWKIMPIREFVRGELERRKLPMSAGAVEMWTGISFDEIGRMRPSDAAYIVNAYPLADRKITRIDCVAWLRAKGLPVPVKSGCVFCPYRRVALWKEEKRKGGADWEKAVAVDAAIRRRLPLRSGGQSNPMIEHVECDHPFCVWKPLQKIIADCEAWMFMGRAGTVYLYKHCDTRRYLNVDEAGRCYTWDRVSDSYIPAVKEVAVAHALS